MHRQVLVPLPCTLIASSLFGIGITNPVNAFSLRKVYADEAKAGIQLKVWPGYGISINLMPLHAKIRGAWIGDQSHFTLSSNGRLCPQVAGAEPSPTCVGPDASVIYLRQALISIPDMMSSSNGSTVLRLSIDEPNGEEQLVFQLIPAKGEPEYTDVSILPESEKPAPLLLSSAKPPSSPQSASTVSLHPVPTHIEQKAEGRRQKVWNALPLATKNQIPARSLTEGKKWTEGPKSHQSSSDAESSGACGLLCDFNSRVATESKMTPGNSDSCSLQLPVVTGSRPSAFCPQVSSAFPINVEQTAVKSLASVPNQSSKPPKDQLDTTHSLLPAQTQQEKTLTSAPNQSFKPPKDRADTAPGLLAGQTHQQKALTNLLLALESQHQTAPIATKHFQINSSIENANAVAFGLRVANENGQIRARSGVWQQVQDAIIWLRRGYSINDAADKSNLRLSILQQLIQWGQSRP